MPYRYDTSKISGVVKTSQGYLRIPASIARADCVLTYRMADGSTVKEFRPRDEVFSEYSLNSARSAPVTVGHITKLDSTNTNKYSKGHVSDNLEPNGNLLDTEVIVTDQSTIDKIDNKELIEISPGYSVDIEEKAGIYNGERYDRIQRSIVYNHIALLPMGKGRQGSEVSLRLDSEDGILEETGKEKNEMKVKIRLDGKEYEVEVSNETEAQLVRDLNDRNDSNSKEVEKLKGQNQTLTEEKKAAVDRADKAESQETINSQVNFRLDAIDKLKSFKKEVKVKDLEDKTLKDLHLDCLEAAGKNRESFEGRTDDFISGAFEALTAPESKPAVRSVGGPIPKDRKDAKEVKEDKNDVGSAKEAMNSAINNAWKREVK